MLQAKEQQGKSLRQLHTYCILRAAKSLVWSEWREKRRGLGISQRGTKRPYGPIIRLGLLL